MSLTKLDIKPRSESVKETLNDMLERADHLDGVICIALTKEGSQFLMASSTSSMERSFLLAFANAWLAKWFHLEHGDIK